MTVWDLSLREKCPHSEFSGPYFLTFSPNARKYGSEKLRIRLYCWSEWQDLIRRITDKVTNLGKYENISSCHILPMKFENSRNFLIISVCHEYISFLLQKVRVLSCVFDYVSVFSQVVPAFLGLKYSQHLFRSVSFSIGEAWKYLKESFGISLCGKLPIYISSITQNLARKIIFLLPEKEVYFRTLSYIFCILFFSYQL